MLDDESGQKYNHIPYYYETLTFICDINLVFCPNNITFARKFNKYVFKNGKQDLQAYDGDVGAPIR